MGGSWMMMGGNDKDEDSKFKAFDFFFHVLLMLT
jgi:hypothetical protein